MHVETVINDNIPTAIISVNSVNFTLTVTYEALLALASASVTI